MQILIVLTIINLLNYIDRYIFSALAPVMQKELILTDAQIGMLGSGFIFAYLLISPVFGHWGDRGPRNRIMAAGIGLWSMATALSGVAMSFAAQMWARVTVGLGEASYSCIAPSVLADAFPAEKRGRVYAVYSGAIPIGTALGYILGGTLATYFGWQRAFFFVGTPGLALALCLWFIREPKRSHSEIAGTEVVGAGWRQWWEDYRTLFANPGFMAVVLGYSAYTFVVGGMAFWMPSFIVRYFDVNLAQGTTIFGGVTVVGGFVGTLLGGAWADRIEQRTGHGYLKVSVWSVLLATPLFWWALKQNNFVTFSVILFFMEVALFLCMSPLDTAVINFVPARLRATAMALNVFLIHALGDGISRAWIGQQSDASDLRSAIAICPWILLLAAAVWLIGLAIYPQTLAWRWPWRPPRFQAHRGLCRDGVCENTLASVQAATRAGVEGVEFDVQVSQDGVPVLYHDLDLRRMTGDRSKVAALTAAELKKRAGVDTLEEILTANETPRFFNIELKSAAWFGGSFERAVLKVVRAHGSRHQIMFSSFNPFCLRRLSKLAPEIPRAYILTGRGIWPYLIFWTRPHFVHWNAERLHERRAQRWLKRGMQLAVWTVNQRPAADRWLDLGIRSVISDEQVQ